MLILQKKKLLLLFFFFKLLINFNYKKSTILLFCYNVIKLRYNFIYYNILNLLRISNINLLIEFFKFNFITFYKSYKMLYLIEFDNINVYFVKFKSNFFCNWRFLQLSFLDYDNFNLRVSFFLYFRYIKYIEYFRTFKYYEYLSRWSVFGCKNRLFKLSKHVNMNNFIIYISDVIYVRNLNLLFNLSKISKIYKYCKTNINWIFVLQYLYIFFFKFKNNYVIYLLKYLYDFTNYFFIRDCLFKYKHFNNLFKLGNFCWHLSLPYENYFKAKSYIFIFKKLYYNIFFKNYALTFYYISFLKSNIRLYRLGILNCFALAFFKYVKYLNLNESLRINFVMLWSYYNEYDCFEFTEFYNIITDFRYYKYTIFYSLFNFMTLSQNMSINYMNWRLYYQIDLNSFKFYYWLKNFMEFYLLNFKCENFYLLNLSGFFFDIFIKIINNCSNNYFIISLIFTKDYILFYLKSYIFKLFQRVRIFLQKYIKFVSYFEMNEIEYTVIEETEEEIEEEIEEEFDEEEIDEEF